MIRYTLLAEGIVENIFIPGLLKKISRKQFSKSKLYIKPSASPSKSKVLKNVLKFATESIIINGETLFIVGVDLDAPDHDQMGSKKLEAKIRKEIPNDIEKKKVIVFIPVQVFDHWLYYQSYKTNSKPKIQSNSLESENSKTIKKKLYGSSSPNQFEIKSVAEKIMNVLDVNELKKQSKSFNHFCKQLEHWI